jgi:hypothetical protein
MQTPNFQVEAAGYGVSLNWKDDSRRYHVWLNDDGSLNVGGLGHGYPLAVRRMISLCFRRLWAENARLSARRFPSSPSAVIPALLMIMGVAVVGVVAKGKLSTGKGTKGGSKFRAWSPSLREETTKMVVPAASAWWSARCRKRRCSRSLPPSTEHSNKGLYNARGQTSRRPAA